MPRAPCSRKTTRAPHACTYVLGSPLCAGVIALCCAVLCFAVDSQRQYTRTYNENEKAGEKNVKKAKKKQKFEKVPQQIILSSANTGFFKGSEVGEYIERVLLSRRDLHKSILSYV